MSSGACCCGRFDRQQGCDRRGLLYDDRNARFSRIYGSDLPLCGLEQRRKGVYSAEKHWAWKLRSLRHFVDLVWIFFYPALYLIGKLI